MAPKTQTTPPEQKAGDEKTQTTPPEQKAAKSGMVTIKIKRPQGDTRQGINMRPEDDKFIVNGVLCPSIPFDKQVEIPIRFADALSHAYEIQVASEERADGTKRSRKTIEPRYNYVIAE